MATFDDDLIDDAFDGFTRAAAPAVTAPGPLAVRATVRRRRRVRVTAIALAAVVALVAPVVAYASVDRALPAPPPGTSSPSPPASPPASPSPSPTPVPTGPDGRLTPADLAAARPAVPAWGAAGEGCATTGLLGTEGPAGQPYVLTVAHANLDADTSRETAALVQCRRGETAIGQVVAYDRDTAGRVVELGRLVVSTEDFKGVWDVMAVPEGGVVVEISERVACCSAPVSTEKHSYRWYRWDGAGYADIPAPPDAPLWSIPDRLFANTNTERLSRSVPPPDEAILPDLCDPRFASDGAIQARRTLDIPYIIGADREQIPSGDVLHTITTYSAGRAERFMAELAAAVAACPDVRGRHNETVPARTFGDQSLLIRVAFTVTVGGGQTEPGTRLAYVVRVGEAVEILYDVGWENSTPNRPYLEGVVTRAVELMRARLG